MIVATTTKDFDFIIMGQVIKKFKAGKSYVMSEFSLSDIQLYTGNAVFTNIREMNFYKKYSGEDLTNKSIIVWRTGGAGDLCFITPFLKKLKELFPTCKIVFGCGPQYLDVVSGLSFIDELVSLPIEEDIIKGCDYNLMFEGIIENNPRASTTNAYDLFGEAFNIELSPKEKIPSLCVCVENNNDFASFKDKVIKKSIENPIIVGIHLKTSSPMRTVPVNLWERIVYDLLKANDRIVVCLLGSPEDRDFGSMIPIYKDVEGRIIPHYAVTRGFKDLIAAIANMDLIIGGDSAGLHIGAAFGVPVLGIFGAFKSDLRLRYYRPAIGIDSEIKCSPCFAHGNMPCGNSDKNGTPYCMMIHESSKIIEEAMLLLAHVGKLSAGDKIPFKSLMVSEQMKKENEKNNG